MVQLLREQCMVSDHIIDEATDKIILPQSFLDSILREYANRDLPYPITFALSCGNKKTHVGVREFSSEAGLIRLPQMVADNLAAKPGMIVSVDLSHLEKGESAKLRPLAAGYDLNQDWKIALEGAFRSHYTTLTKGDVIILKSGMRFLVDELEPADAVCIVDTDLEVELEPLSEEQAIQTVKVTEALSNASVALHITLNQSFEGVSDVQNTFELSSWDKTKPVIILLEASLPDFALVVGSDGRRPDLRYNIWNDLSSRVSKKIEIQPGNVELANFSTLQISVISLDAAHFVLNVKQEQDAAESLGAVVDEELVRCSNCSVVVPKRSLVLHERHCQRNNVKCSHFGCDFIFKRGSDTRHWHCPDCGDPGEGSIELHIQRCHSVQQCECTLEFPTLSTLAHHRATSCPEKIITCRFCHLMVAQGDETQVSYMDAAQHHSLHEVTCGSRTAACESCGRLCKLKDYATHMRIHESQRLGRSTPSLCSNQNCVRQAGPQTPFGLCPACFGPLYSATQDEDGLKLQQRLKRRYATQLMNGCRHTHCRNIYCATATGLKMTYAAALKRVEEKIDGKHWFCVDEAIQRKRVQAEVLECEGEYAIEWCSRAVDASGGDVGMARSWLTREAVKKSEV